MQGEFISPNWHTILIHYPIALLTIGVLLEICARLWPESSVRTAGRLMIAIGAFLAVPAAFAGIYAFRDAVRPELADVTPMPWQRVVEASDWQATQWELLWWHTLLNSIATGIVVLVVAVWIALGNVLRTLLYLPCLLLLLAGVALMGIGSWYGGEAVYLHGTAVAAHSSAEPAPEDAPDQEAASEGGAFAWEYFAPPLQLHVVLAGFAVAVAIWATAFSVRLWIHQSPESSEGKRNSKLAERFWLGTSAAGLLAALAAWWSAEGNPIVDDLFSSLTAWTDPDHLRFAVHIGFGIALLVLPAFLALLCWLAPQRRILAGIFTLLLLGVACAQVWWGVLLLYDGHQGPLFAFVSAAELNRAHRHTPNHRGEPSESGNQGDDSSDASDPGLHVVGMTDELAYAPVSLTIQPGETVRWVNESSIAHTITADPDKAKNADNVQLPEGAAAFDSGTVEPGQTFERVFEVPGRYKYFCIPHERAGMIGTITVRPRPETEADSPGQSDTANPSP